MLGFFLFSESLNSELILFRSPGVLQTPKFFFILLLILCTKKKIILERPQATTTGTLHHRHRTNTHRGPQHVPLGKRGYRTDVTLLDGKHLKTSISISARSRAKRSISTKLLMRVPAPAAEFPRSRGRGVGTAGVKVGERGR